MSLSDAIHFWIAKSLVELAAAGAVIVLLGLALLVGVIGDALRK